MIASLKGTVQHKALDHMVVEVGGVGYHLWISSQTLADLPQAGQPVQLLCHTHVREDALQLFGFSVEQERTVFEALIAVSGVGPKLALTILSGMAVGRLIDAIVAGDHGRLQKIPGVGKKTAERLVVELKDRFGRLGAAQQTAVRAPQAPATDDVLEALVNLGYKRAQAERAVRKVLERFGGDVEAIAPEQVLRESLSTIASL